MKKTILAALVGLSLALTVHGQDAPASQPTLDALIGPIALYPDALVALVLPASTDASDIVLADRYIQANGDPAAIDSQPWSDSVKALAHYPAVIAWMDQNLSWTQALGNAFLAQPADVMNTVQSLRVRAINSGALASTPQQQVINQGGQIFIQPAQPNVVYVPTYDPNIVYTQRVVWGSPPLLTFGLSYAIGSSFIYDCNWSGGSVIVISNPRTYWHSNARYSHPSGPRPSPYGQAWHAPAGYHPRPVATVHYTHPVPIRPSPSNVRIVNTTRQGTVTVTQTPRRDTRPGTNQQRVNNTPRTRTNVYQNGQPNGSYQNRPRTPYTVNRSNQPPVHNQRPTVTPRPAPAPKPAPRPAPSPRPAPRPPITPAPQQTPPQNNGRTLLHQ